MSNKLKPYIPKPKVETAAPILEGDDYRFSLSKRSIAQRLISLNISANNNPREMICVHLNDTSQEK